MCRKPPQTSLRSDFHPEPLPEDVRARGEDLSGPRGGGEPGPQNQTAPLEAAGPWEPALCSAKQGSSSLAPQAVLAPVQRVFTSTPAPSRPRAKARGPAAERTCATCFAEFLSDLGREKTGTDPLGHRVDRNLW